MTRCRALLVSAALLLSAASAPFGARAQSSSATPFSNTNVDTGPSIPLSGFNTDQPNNIAMSSSANNAGQVLWYIGQGFNPNQPDYTGRSALMYAALNNNALIAKILLDHSADVDARDKLGNTALHLAADRGSLDVMRELLDAKAQVDVQNRQGITPLMMAANNGHADAVKLLLKYNADTGKQDYTGRDALGWAGNKTAVVQLLKNPASTR